MIPDEGTGSSSTPIVVVVIVAPVVIVVDGGIFIDSSQELFGSDNPFTMSDLLVLVLSMVIYTHSSLSIHFFSWYISWFRDDFVLFFFVKK